MKCLTIFAAATLLVATCGQKEPQKQTGGEVSFEPAEIVVSSQACEVAVRVTAEADWGVSPEDKTWVGVAPSGGGKGTSELKVSISANDSGDARETNLVFRSGSNKKSLPVRQNYLVEAVCIHDIHFLNALLKDWDEDNDGLLSTVEAAKVTRINAKGCKIVEMSELGTLFTKVTELDCSDNELSEIDIQNLTRLTKFDCTGNPDLKTIYVWSGFKAPEGFHKPEGADYVEPDIPTPVGYSLVWQDEFNGDTVDNTKWTFENWAPGRVNNELQRYVSGGVLDGNRTAFIEDGVLNIRAMKYNGQVISARMNSTGYWKYGYIEARIKLPKGKGTWPAFWMMPKDQSKGWPACGEIDIMEEVGVNPNFTSSSIHCKAYNHTIGTQKTKERYTAKAEDEFHTYAIEWTPEGISSYVDGIHDGTTLTFLNDGKGDDNTWPFNKTFFIILNLAWGGDWGGYNGVDENKLPATLQVDYVRVFQKND